MNTGLKSKTFNILGTPDVLPGLALETVLEAGARLIGIVSSVTTNIGDVAAWSLFASVGGVDTIVANSNVNGAGVAKSRSWWAGIDGRYNDTEILAAGASADTQRGWWPMTTPQKWIDTTGGSTYDLKLAIDTTLFGSIIVFYTVDPPNCYGEQF